MDVRMKMEQLPKGLNASDQTGHHAFPPEHVTVDFDDAFPGSTCQQAKLAVIVTAVDTEPLGDGENNLPLRHRGTNPVGDGWGDGQ